MKLSGHNISFTESGGFSGSTFCMKVDSEEHRISCIEENDAIEVFKIILLQKYKITEPSQPIVFQWDGTL